MIPPAVPQPTDFEHAVRRMLQSLDAYWLGYEGLPHGRYPRGQYGQEDWWNRYERYRATAEAIMGEGIVLR